MNFDFTLNWGALVWAIGWAVALVATVFNLKDNWRGWSETMESDDPKSVLATAFWMVRQDALKGVACGFMVIGGVVSFIGGEPDVTRFCVLLASAVIAGNQVWNRADRMIVVRLLRKERARELEKEPAQ